MVLGAVAHATGMSPAGLAEVVGYDDVQTVASAALKLRPLDPAVATAGSSPPCHSWRRSSSEVAGLTAPDRHPGHRLAADRELAEAHAVTTRRLFRA